MDTHPEEIVFIELVHEYGRLLNDAQREWIYRRTVQAFGDRLVTSMDQNDWARIPDVTLGKMKEKKKTCWLFVHEKLL